MSAEVVLLRLFDVLRCECKLRLNYGGLLRLCCVSVFVMFPSKFLLYTNLISLMIIILIARGYWLIYLLWYADLNVQNHCVSLVTFRWL